MIRPKCMRSEFKDGRHLWHDLVWMNVGNVVGQYCAACGMYRIKGRSFFLNDLRGLKRGHGGFPWGYALAAGIVLFAAYQYGVMIGVLPALFRYPS